MLFTIKNGLCCYVYGHQCYAVISFLTVYVAIMISWSGTVYIRSGFIVAIQDECMYPSWFVSSLLDMLYVLIYDTC